MKYGPIDWLPFRWNAVFRFGRRHDVGRVRRCLFIRFAKSTWSFALWRL